MREGGSVEIESLSLSGRSALYEGVTARTVELSMLRPTTIEVAFAV